MALKHRVSVAEFTALAADVQAEYRMVQGVYVLDLADVDPDLVATQAELKAERQAKIKAQSELDAANLAKEAHASKLEAKYADELKAANDKVTAYATTLVSKEVNGEIAKIAGKFKAAPLFEAQLKNQITGELQDDGTVKMTYLDSKGQPTDFDKLSKSYLENADYAAMLTVPSKSGTLLPPPPAGVPPVAGAPTAPNADGSRGTVGKSKEQIKAALSDKYPSVFTAPPTQQ